MLEAEIITSILSGIKHLFVRKITFTKPSGFGKRNLSNKLTVISPSNKYQET